MSGTLHALSHDRIDILTSKNILQILMCNLLYVFFQLIVISGLPLVHKFSYCKVIRYSYICTVVAGITMYCIGQGHPWCLMVFLLLDR